MVAATSLAQRVRLDVRSCGIFAFVRALLSVGTLFASLWAAGACAAVLAGCFLSCTKPGFYFRHRPPRSPRKIHVSRSNLCRSLCNKSMCGEVSDKKGLGRHDIVVEISPVAHCLLPCPVLGSWAL